VDHLRKDTTVGVPQPESESKDEPPTSASTRQLQSTAMFDGQIADEFVRYTVMDNPNFDSSTFNLALAGQWSGRISMLSGLDATDADLTRFMRRRGVIRALL
jgi:feruloyl esterase